MPELCRFDGMIIRMQFSDNDKHHKPHVHVEYAEHNMSISIDGEPLDGSLPKRQYRLLQGWLVAREDELYTAWNKAVRNIPVDKVEPLR